MTKKISLYLALIHFINTKINYTAFYINEWQEEESLYIGLDL